VWGDCGHGCDDSRLGGALGTMAGFERYSLERLRVFRPILGRGIRGFVRVLSLVRTVRVLKTEIRDDDF